MSFGAYLQGLQDLQQSQVLPPGPIDWVVREWVVVSQSQPVPRIYEIYLLLGFYFTYILVL